MSASPTETPFTITDGFPPDQRGTAIRLFWSAFKAKLHPVMKPEEKALGFLDLAADPAHALGAIAPDGTLIGIAGYKTKDGSFIGGELREFAAVYGWFGGVWRGLVLSLLERPLEPMTLLMDGIVVSENARGQGVGSALLTAVKQKALSLGCRQVRLDVIDINPRARALYERQGFAAGNTTDIGPLRYLFGFRKATKMICEV